MTRNDGMVPCFRHGHQLVGSCQDGMDHGSFHIAVMKQHDKHWINLRMILGGVLQEFSGIYPLVIVFNIAMVC